MNEQWIAKYTEKEKPIDRDRTLKYYTLSAYTINDAARIAENWTPKDFTLLSVTQKD